MGDQKIQNHEASDVHNPERQLQGSLDSTNLFLHGSLQGLNSLDSSAIPTGCDHLTHSQPCTVFGCSGSNSMKRRSPSSCPSLQDPSCSVTESDSEPRAKKHFCQQEGPTFHGFSTISLPSLGTLPATQNANACPVLRRCISDPYNPNAATVGGIPVSPCHSPERFNGITNPVTLLSLRGSASGSGLIPLRRSLKRCASDPTSSSAQTSSHPLRSGDTGMDLTREETPNLMRLRRMKDRLREMRQWWDEVMQKEEEEDDHQGAEDNRVPCKDDFGRDAEEAVKVEWAKKCLSINFKCPCGKGYQILLSENNCYYKLV